MSTIITHIYCDADGVIADFDKLVYQITGKWPSELKKSHMWASIRKYISNGGRFWYDLEKMSDADVLMSFLFSTNIPVSILTAGGDERSAAQDKLDWFEERYLGVPVIITHKSLDKAVHAAPTTILIDDRSKSIDPWVEAGGIGILHTSAESTIIQLQQILKGS